jgi:uncharacterized membrane protein
VSQFFSSPCVAGSFWRSVSDEIDLLTKIFSSKISSREIMDEPDCTSVSCSDCAAQMPATAAFCPSCGRSMLAVQRAQGKVGIFSECFAGALAYLTFIPAIIFLLRPPYNQNPFVRFHSVQCLLFWLASLCIAAVLRLAAVFVILIPVIGPLLITLISFVFALALVVIWAVLVAKAFQGEIFELPVLGALADRYADPL